jgi:hypothetical protein
MQLRLNRFRLKKKRLSLLKKKLLLQQLKKLRRMKNLRMLMLSAQKTTS